MTKTLSKDIGNCVFCAKFAEPKDKSIQWVGSVAVFEPLNPVTKGQETLDLIIGVVLFIVFVGGTLALVIGSRDYSQSVNIEKRKK